MKAKNKRVAALALATALTFSLSAPFTLPQARATDNTSVSMNVRSGEELATLVNPIVQKYTVDDSQQTWVMSPSTRLAVLATQENVENERLAEVVKLVNSEFVEKEVVSSTPFTMVYANEEDVASADVLIKLDTDSSLYDGSESTEAYRIDIGADGVVITAASENAVMYALRTIQNYMVANDGLPYGTIVDYPDVAERRLHVDCARKYISKDWFIRQIREMSFLKMNAIQIHFSENLGFRIECETDPSIVSDEYLTKDEVREILAEAEKYGVKVIPSFDSPGHVDQILRAHPEYGQISNKGSHYKSGLDVTNPEAVEYIYSLYDEYMELFEGCTDFHIGGDEYMEFDRAPFTTEYKSVLNDYAKKTLGSEYQWKDVLANYINELAEHVYSKGFTPRVWNDGLYYGENSWEGAQRIVMHDYIGVDFWSQMGWNRDIANLQTFINKGHDTIYNVNASFFYYVLRNDKPTDGREQHSFDVLNQDKNIFENWTPGKFQSNTIADDHPSIKGTSMAIWCDNPTLVDEDVITEDIADELRALASKAWNVESNSTINFEQFKENYQVLGNVAGFEKGSTLPDAGEFQSAESLGTVTLRYVSDTGKVLKEDVVKYGTIGNEYTFTADEIYGYKLVSEGNVSGTYSKEGDVYTFTYTLFTDKTDLGAELEAKLNAADYIPATFAEYQTALDAAQAVYDQEDSEQLAVDEALAALTEAKAKAVLLKNFALYVETQFPLTDIGYQSGYTEYKAAVNAAKDVLYSQGNDAQAVAAALESVNTAKAALMLPDGNTPTVSATDSYYQSYSYDKMLDGNLNTWCWFEKDQEAGKEFVFTFPQAVNMSQIRVVQPSNVGADILEGADVQVSTDKETWTTVGHLDSSSSDTTIEFDSTVVKYVRVLLTATKKNWYQISEVQFTSEQIPEDTTVRDIIAEAEAIDVTGKDVTAVNTMIDALIEVQKLYAEDSKDTAEAVAALRTAIDQLTDTDEPATEASKALLQKVYDYAAAQDTSNLIPTVAAKYQAALDQAKAVLADPNATQPEVDKATEDLFEAVHLLDFTQGDKEALNLLIERAKEMVANEDQYMDTNWQMLLDALDKAEAVSADPDALQYEVDAAYAALLEAIEAQQLRCDKSMLELLIDRANGMVENADKYVETNWQMLLDALEKAQTVYDDPNATQAEVETACDELLEAIMAQRFKADKSILDDLINQAENMNLDGYPAEAVATFRTALANAQAVMADNSLSVDDQKTVDDAVAALTAAMDGLTADGTPETTDKPEASAKPDASSKPEATTKPEKVPQTGDNSHLAAWATAGVISLAGAAYVVTRRKDEADQ